MFRFTIRDVLWLTVVVAFAVAWGLDHWHAASERQKADGELERARQAKMLERERTQSLEMRLRVVLQQMRSP